MSTNALPMYVVSAFTHRLFGGNPAAVVLLEQPLAESQMQAIAAENRLSETAFVYQQQTGHYAIRWFSPVREIPFCGHATLAAAWVLLSQQPALAELVFSTGAVGDIAVQRGQEGYLQMRFPLGRLLPMDTWPQDVVAGLSQRPVALWQNQQAYVAEYASEDAVRQLQVQPTALQHSLPKDIVATAPAREGSQHDFVSRYFWRDTPDWEDPVTGSIHAALAPFWSQRLHKSELHAAQLSMRGGHLVCRVTDDAVWVAGQCVLYLTGKLAAAVADEIA